MCALLWVYSLTICFFVKLRLSGRSVCAYVRGDRLYVEILENKVLWFCSSSSTYIPTTQLPHHQLIIFRGINFAMALTLPTTALLCFYKASSTAQAAVVAVLHYAAQKRHGNRCDRLLPVFLFLTCCDEHLWFSTWEWQRSAGSWRSLPVAVATAATQTRPLRQYGKICPPQLAQCDDQWLIMIICIGEAE